MLGWRRPLKALSIAGWLEGENPLLMALIAAYKLEKTRARSLVAATFSLTAKVIILALNTLARFNFPLRAFTFLLFFYTDIA